MGELRLTALDGDVVDQLLKRTIAAYNHHDVDAMRDLMTEDIVFDSSAAPARMHGRNEACAFFAGIWTMLPDLTIELADGPFLHPHAPRFSLRWRAVGTHTGPFDSPRLAATGRRVEMDIREILELRDGLVSRLHVAVDMADVMRQLGVLPARGSLGERVLATLQRVQTKTSRRHRPRGRAVSGRDRR